MRLKVIGSSSRGNCYLLCGDSETLIIEAGIRYPSILKALDFDLERVVGCIVSHEHQDHSRSVKELIAAGIDVYTSRGTFEALGVDGYRAHILTPEVPVHIGEFKVLPFPVEHDCAEPFGFLIKHKESGNILFATDTGYLQYRFDNLNQAIIEANYHDEILEDNIRSGRVPEIVRKRVQNTHMDLRVLLDILKANDLSMVNNIVLIHLSDENSDEEMFVGVVKEQTGKSVVAAFPGMDVDFNLTPF